MERNESLKEVERRAYRSTLEDGFYELLWGGLFLVFAWIPILESIGISRFYCYPSILILLIIPWLGKRYVTIPRLGMVEFGEKRKSRGRYTTLIGIAAVALMLPLVIMMLTQGFPGSLTWSTIALIAAPLIAIGVFLMDYSGMYIYAILFFFSIVVSEIFHAHSHLPSISLLAFGIPGGTIACYGLFLLYRFLKDYPKPTAGASDVSR
jgi:hypothetical protein